MSRVAVVRFGVVQVAPHAAQAVAGGGYSLPMRGAG